MQRLLHARKVMEQVRDEQRPFNMATWFAPSDPEYAHDCQTAACFGGWCARDPLFQAEGLGIFMEMPAYSDRVGSVALANFFNIKLPDAKFLTLPRNYEELVGTADRIHPQHVIDHLDIVIKRYS